jgi:tetratricopeptide (TPR) repeat protein
MPYIHNGVGTWYYGKRRIHSRKGTCEFCKRVVELKSYDTTLYFVFFMVPLIPLGQKRIFNQCSTCSRHRVMPLKQWEANKAAAVAQLLEKLQRDPDNRDTILSGLALASGYQDQALLDKLADALARHRTDDAAIQAQLGASYFYFARYAEAEAAYRASLAVQDDPAVRRQLGWALLKQSRPREAAACLQHILDQRLKEHAGMIYLLAEGYQAEGLHQEALALMDQRDAAFPELAATKDWAKQRKTSERYRDTEKRVRSAYLSEPSQAGYREGTWLAKAPRLIGPLILLGLLGWYLGAAVWIGQAQRVWLVSGWDKPYTVAVNGQEMKLAPGSHTPIRVREGDVTVEFRDPNLALEPVHGRVESLFWTRPFVRHTFVINPDEVAVLEKEDGYFAQHNPPPGPPPQLLLGKPFYAFDGIDYEFEPFPGSVEVSEGSTVRKTRLGAYPNLTSDVRLRVAGQVLGQPEQEEYARRLLQLNPNDVLTLNWLVGRLGDEGGLAFLRPHLADRPLRVEWQRAYQTLMAKAHPDKDLRPDYRQLVAETGRQPDAVYLLARMPNQNPDEADKLFQEAATADPPSVYAQYALGDDAIGAGRPDEGLRWMKMAFDRAPDNVTVLYGYHEALLAAKQYDALLNLLRTWQVKPGLRVPMLVDQVRVYGLKGDQARAREVMAEVLPAAGNGANPAARQRTEDNLELVLACARGDAARFLELAERVGGESKFEAAVLRGNLREATGLVEPATENTVSQRALLYLAAVKAGDKKLADEQWSLLLAALKKEGGPARQLAEMLAGPKPPDVARIRRLVITAEQKRVLVAAVARRYPETAKELVALGRKLDFAGDGTSLCLRKLLE